MRKLALTSAGMPQDAGSPDDWLTPAEVGHITRLTTSTLKDKRWRGTGPKFTKLSPGRGGRIRYRRADVDAWINGERSEAVA
ncbi:helix-turn-helix domain-containing protein [Streptomyces sp. NBC_01622]|uniref:helix-turn-helix transcriptional regulator n=1 Tax=Streptomyces sp. NBC_01622 TaxID=2975903 RepID=UPI0038646A16|nr:helix-turn-helix domain-containing protein [Streptomyces sp. NBC_01622]